MLSARKGVLIAFLAACAATPPVSAATRKGSADSGITASAPSQPTPSTPDRAAATTATAGVTVRAIASLPPMIGLIQPIVDAARGGDASAKPRDSRVTSLIPPGRSEHGYEIPPAKLAELASSDVIVLVGLGLENQVEAFLESHPASPDRPRRVVRFSDVAGIDDDHASHSHDEHGNCVHHGADPHLWLDPVLVEKLVSAIEHAVLDSLASSGGANSADSAAAGRVRTAAEELRARVRAVHERYAVACAAFKVKTIVVAHDAWGRLAARYGLETIAIANLNAAEPTPAALDRARRAVKDRNLTTIFLEPQLSDRAGRRVAQMTGVEARMLDPLGSGDWFAMMESNLAELSRALGSTEAPAPPAKPTAPAP